MPTQKFRTERNALHCASKITGARRPCTGLTALSCYISAMRRKRRYPQAPRAPPQSRTLREVAVMVEGSAPFTQVIGGGRLDLPRGLVLVGRGDEADLRLPSPEVSTRHAWLRRDDRTTGRPGSTTRTPPTGRGSTVASWPAVANRSCTTAIGSSSGRSPRSTRTPRGASTPARGFSDVRRKGPRTATSPPAPSTTPVVTSTTPTTSASTTGSSSRLPKAKRSTSSPPDAVRAGP